MFNVIRLPTKFSRTIKRFSQKEKSELLDILIKIGDGESVIIPDNIVGDTIGLIYGEWMNMESKNGNKPEISLIKYSSESVGQVNPSNPTPKVEESIVEESKVKESKVKLGEYKNVLLSVTEKNKLIEEYGEEQFNTYLKTLSEGIEMKGYKYKNHNLAIRNWMKRDGAKKIDIKQEDSLTAYEKQKKEKLIRYYGDDWEKHW